MAARDPYYDYLLEEDPYERVEGGSRYEGPIGRRESPTAERLRLAGSTGWRSRQYRTRLADLGADWTERQGRVMGSSAGGLETRFRELTGIDWTNPNARQELDRYIAGVRTSDPNAAREAEEVFFRLQQLGPDRFKPIDVSGMFDETQRVVGERAAAAGLEAERAIDRAAARASTRAEYAAAATGQTRGGLSQGIQAEIGEGAVDATADAISRIQTEKFQIEADLEFKRDQLQYAEQLRVQQWKEEDIETALGFSRALYEATFKNELNKDLLAFQADLQDDFSWGDVFGGFIDLASSSLSLYTDYKILDKVVG